MQKLNYVPNLLAKSCPADTDTAVGRRTPTAVFSCNVPCTMALVLARYQAGHNGVAIVGFGDFPMAAALSPAVTVVDQYPADLGRVAVERLLQRIEDPPWCAAGRCSRFR